VFLKLWKMYNMSLLIKDGDRKLLRVEVLEARADGTARFRLWYYKWRKTRPDKPYVDIEIEPYHFKDGRIGFLLPHLCQRGRGHLPGAFDRNRETVEGQGRGRRIAE